MGKYKIVYDHESCIGAAECEALSPELWKLNRDNRAILNHGVKNPKTGKFELVIDESQVANQNSVAGACPAGCISIEKLP